MDNLFILSSILLIIVIIAIFFPIHRHTHTIHKIHPTIVRPSYWITPTGPSWYPPRHRYHYQYSSGPSYRNYYRNLNNLYKNNNINRKQKFYYPKKVVNNSSNKGKKNKKSKKEPFINSFI
jgi:hypothetical protein